ncbi:MAG: anti-sigma factor domain-containing protein [Bryobacteraceae bacterium]
MNCEEIRDRLEFYALGLLDGSEQKEVAAHLAGGCEGCAAALRRAVALNAALGATAPEASLPKHLKPRVMAALTAKRSGASSPKAWIGLAASLAVAVLLLGLSLRRDRDRMAAMERELRQTRSHQEAMRQSMLVLSQPGTRMIGSAGETRGAYYVNGDHGVVLIAANLDAPERGRAYQMWIIPRTGNPRPAGVFRPAQTGTAIHYFETRFDPAATAALAITDEPEAGSAAPTTAPFLVASFSN